jgi:hypothetical protein
LAFASELAACSRSPKSLQSESSAEQTVKLIALSGPASAKSAELSSLAWHGTTLILLPQYADTLNKDGSGGVYALPKEQIENYLQQKSARPLNPRVIPLSAPDLRKKVPGFEGFEAIAFSGDKVFLTIESHDKSAMKGYLVAGTTDPSLTRIDLDTEHLTPISPQAALGNMSDEAMIVDGQRILTFYEANGLNVNPTPIAHQFTADLSPQPDLPFPHLEYRVTDATPPDDQGRFWVINYLYPGETSLLKPAADSLGPKWAPNLQPSPSGSVERLVQLQITPRGIEIANRSPIWLVLPQNQASHNWEGIAPFNNGFLLVTDSYPQTLLGYVKAYP